MLFGLGAALGWGFADLFAALSSRRVGAFATVVLAQAASAILVTVVMVVAGPDLSGLGEVATWLLPNAVVTAAAYLTLYRALELGPVAVVSPVLAAYAVLPVLLAVVLLGESLGGPQILGIVVTVAGAMLASTDLRAVARGRGGISAGLPWAIASALLFGVATYVLGWAARRAGWLPSLWVARSSTAMLFGIVAIALRARTGRSFGSLLPIPAIGLAAVLGVVDLAGTMSYSRGAEVGLVSIVTAVSAIYPLIPVFGGVTLFGERPAANQYLGVVMVVAGLVVLGAA